MRVLNLVVFGDFMCWFGFYDEFVCLLGAIGLFYLEHVVFALILTSLCLGLTLLWG